MSQLEDFHLEVQKKFYKYPSFSLDKYKKDERFSPDDTNSPDRCFNSPSKCFNSNLYSSLEKLGILEHIIPTANNILGEERPRYLTRREHIKTRK